MNEDTEMKADPLPEPESKMEVSEQAEPQNDSTADLVEAPKIEQTEESV